MYFSVCWRLNINQWVTSLAWSHSLNRISCFTGHGAPTRQVPLCVSFISLRKHHIGVIFSAFMYSSCETRGALRYFIAHFLLFDSIWLLWFHFWKISIIYHSNTQTMNKTPNIFHFSLVIPYLDSYQDEGQFYIITPAANHRGAYACVPVHNSCTRTVGRNIGPRRCMMWSECVVSLTFSAGVCMCEPPPVTGHDSLS